MNRPCVAVASAAIMTTVLGSIHAFSVFVPEWELQFDAARSSVSLVYSVALVSLTVLVLLGYKLYARFPAWVLFLVAGLGAAAGLALSANSTSITGLIVSYGLLFGAANGLGYGFALQLAGQAMPARKGLAMGLVTAFYAVGATVFPFLFARLIESGGNSLALIVMGVIIILASGLAAALVLLSQTGYHAESAESGDALPPEQRQVRLLFWIGYGAGATAGLMVIGHAFGIARWSGLSIRNATLAVTLLSFGNMLGGFVAGYIADRVSSRRVLFWLCLLSGTALSAIYFQGLRAISIVLTSIALVGFAYGALIAVYPVAVSDVFGKRLAARVYGQVFTAWGLAGLLGPWSSGWLYDRTGSYNIALLLAVLLCGVSAIATRYFPESRATR